MTILTTWLDRLEKDGYQIPKEYKLTIPTLLETVERLKNIKSAVSISDLESMQHLLIEFTFIQQLNNLDASRVPVLEPLVLINGQITD